ncbi:MAG: choice-of-anchor tandem repeat GloVer-containing protein, partial [Candidatus Korobacteraceae bacterium]
GAYGHGSVFKLTPGEGGWTYTSLHDFTGGQDGTNPISTLIFDASGNLYGTASGGGAYRGGVIFQIAP